MTNADLFKKAHKIAKLTKDFAGSYKLAFVAALEDIRNGVYDNFCFDTAYAMARQTLKAFGANEWKHPTKNETRIYLNDAAERMGYKTQFHCGYFTRTACSKDEALFLFWVAANAGSLLAKAEVKHTRRYEVDDDICDEYECTEYMKASMSAAARRVAAMEAKRVAK